MLCMICKQKSAKVHLTQIVGKKTEKIELCEDCASEKGVTDPNNRSLVDLFDKQSGKGGKR